MFLILCYVVILGAHDLIVARVLVYTLVHVIQYDYRDSKQGYETNQLTPENIKNRTQKINNKDTRLCTTVP